MKVLILGAEGQLGAELAAVFADATLSRADLDGSGHILDIRDEYAVRMLIEHELRPDWVINTAAAHDVPLCEERPGWAFDVNALGARNVALACEACGARMLHIGTDYVFGDTASRPWTESDPPDPVNAYGASKLAGERLIRAVGERHCIVRTAAMYGAAPCRAKGGRNFITLMLHLAATRGEVRVVDDEITTPTHAAALARQIRVIMERGGGGVYHATCQGSCSWYVFAKTLFELTGTRVKLEATATAAFPSSVRRPRYSVLDNQRLRYEGIDIMPDWREALERYLAGRA